jgi:heme O synthase-like polyprenyltransferase
VSEQNSLTMTTTVHSRAAALRLDQFLALTKPRVVSLIVFTAVIGMFLATPGMVALQPLVFGAPAGAEHRRADAADAWAAAAER